MTPAALKALIDSLFAALEVAEPGLASVLAVVNGLIDNIGLPALIAILTALGITSFSTPQQLIDGLFKALETKLAGHPFALMMLSSINTMIDAAISKLTVAPAGFKSL